MSDGALVLYVEGVIDAAQAAMLFGGSLECYTAVKACIVGKSNQQFGAIVRKYLNDHPDQWHMQGTIVVYNAVFMDCLKPKS